MAKYLVTKKYNLERKSEMIIIFLDTNVLYHSFDYGIQIRPAVSQLISQDFEFYIHTKVQEEIMKDLTKTNKIGRKAKFAVDFMSEFKSYDDPRDYRGTDTALLETAKRIQGVVFTFDKELRVRCKKADIPVITHFVKGKLQLIGYIV